MLENRPGGFNSDYADLPYINISMGGWSHTVMFGEDVVYFMHNVSRADNGYGREVFVECKRSDFLELGATKIFDTVREYSLMPCDYGKTRCELELINFMLTLDHFHVKYNE